MLNMKTEQHELHLFLERFSGVHRTQSIQLRRVHHPLPIRLQPFLQITSYEDKGECLTIVPNK